MPARGGRAGPPRSGRPAQDAPPAREVGGYRAERPVAFFVLRPRRDRPRGASTVRPARPSPGERSVVVLVPSARKNPGEEGRRQRAAEEEGQEDLDGHAAEPSPARTKIVEGSAPWP